MNLFELIFLLLAAAASLRFLIIRSHRRASKLPPGPYPLPIVGNIFQLGGSAYRSLANLSKTYGPLMSIRLGSRYTVVVSSPEIAKQILQTHDLVLSGRSPIAAFYAYEYHKQSMICLPVGKQWRKLRKVSREQLFSANRLDSSQVLRQDKLHKMCDYVQECSDSGGEVNIRKAASATLVNLMSGTLFSAEFVRVDSDNDSGFGAAVKNVNRYLADPNIADLFPVLQPLDLQGIERKTRHHLGELFTMIEGMINQRLKSRSTLDYQKKTDFLETILDHGSGFTAEEIKHFFADLVLAGADTSAVATEWTMTELLLNPEKLRKAKQELRTVIGENKLVQESDFPKLPYLQAVIKEAFRLYPLAPLLFPHKAESDVEVSGYVIPKDALVLINVWAIGRDHRLWENPDSFEPERFLGRKLDFAGQDFELLPFGAGRRICPALPLASRMVHSMVATLIHNFDWEFEASAEAAELHRQVLSGISLQKRIPLKAIPINSKP